ncbi:MAG: hypothetical protein IKB23_02140 [Clostridia bacterium]|nr:hypothetical protein [Clostridia bacterium]
MDINIKDFSAIGDGKTNNTEIIQRAIDMCAERGGRVVISDGVYMTGKLVMKSNVELHIEAGAVLLGSPLPSDYPEAEGATSFDSSFLPRKSSACLIFAENCSNISITGMGRIDCNGKNFIEERESFEIHSYKYRRKDGFTPPRVVFFFCCKGVRVENVTMVNQPAGWSYWIHGCSFVTFYGIKIIAPIDYPNNDGIHINSSHDVSISNCHIVSSDDCIVLRANNTSFPENKACERICVSNCTLTSYTNGIRIGWVGDGVIRDCVISNIVITSSNNGISIYLPYRVRTARLVKIFDPREPISSDVGREDTLIENISFQNIMMDGIYKYPILVAIDENEKVGCKDIRNLYFSDIHSTSLNYPCFKGRKNKPIGELYFYNSTFSLAEELDGERSKGEGRIQHYADKIHFINTEFK